MASKAAQVLADVGKRMGQTWSLVSLLVLCTSIKWRRPEDATELLAVTTTTAVLQLVATACEFCPLLHPSTRTFKSAMSAYRDAVEDITEKTSLFDAAARATGARDATATPSVRPSVRPSLGRPGIVLGR